MNEGITNSRSQKPGARSQNEEKAKSEECGLSLIFWLLTPDF
jgi:hypothetical protein